MDPSRIQRSPRCAAGQWRLRDYNGPKSRRSLAPAPPLPSPASELRCYADPGPRAAARALDERRHERWPRRPSRPAAAVVPSSFATASAHQRRRPQRPKPPQRKCSPTRARRQCARNGPPPLASDAAPIDRALLTERIVAPYGWPAFRTARPCEWATARLLLLRAPCKYYYSVLDALGESYLVPVYGVRCT